MAISMLKIRRPWGRLIFNIGIAIPGKTVFLIETAPRILVCFEHSDVYMYSIFAYKIFITPTPMSYGMHAWKQVVKQKCNVYSNKNVIRLSCSIWTGIPYKATVLKCPAFRLCKANGLYKIIAWVIISLFDFLWDNITIYSCGSYCTNRNYDLFGHGGIAPD